MCNISCVISLLLMIVPVPESTVCVFFQIKLFFLKMKLSRPLRRVQNKNFRSELQQLLPDMQCEKCEYQFCEYDIFLQCFFRRGLTMYIKENNPTKKQIDAEISSDTETCSSWKTCREENVLQVIATNYKTKLQINIVCIRMCFP